MRATKAQWIALICLVGAALSACGTDDGSDGGSDGDQGSEEPVVVQITFEDGEVEPNGDRIEVGAGQPIDFEITADEPGAIHIHSDPEEEITYEAGTRTFEIEIARPGVVEVESHNLDQVIVQLEVK
ncbi:cupredoxin domain-containing protein [Nocardioides immobilis]|uniref:cupredoxin domain-containing protein n=1 Tax=Nocardioides immobilis TaxID=2049295 RepID=UPI001FEA3EC9|nr:cupredoxin domain-containing protein [Nocardioides immobilis]